MHCCCCCCCCIALVVSDSVRPHRRHPPGFPSLGFSRQEHWSGLPFPSPMMKVKSESEATQSCPTRSDPRDCSTRLLCPWDFPGKSTGVGCHCLLRTERRESQINHTQKPGPSSTPQHPKPLPPIILTKSTYTSNKIVHPYHQHS